MSTTKSLEQEEFASTRSKAAAICSRISAGNFTTDDVTSIGDYYSQHMSHVIGEMENATAYFNTTMEEYDDKIKDLRKKHEKEILELDGEISKLRRSKLLLTFNNRGPCRSCSDLRAQCTQLENRMAATNGNCANCGDLRNQLECARVESSRLSSESKQAAFELRTSHGHHKECIKKIRNAALRMESGLVDFQKVIRAFDNPGDKGVNTEEVSISGTTSDNVHLKDRPHEPFVDDGDRLGRIKVKLPTYDERKCVEQARDNKAPKPIYPYSNDQTLFFENSGQPGSIRVKLSTYNKRKYVEDKSEETRDRKIQRHSVVTNKSSELGNLGGSSAFMQHKKYAEARQRQDPYYGRPDVFIAALDGRHNIFSASQSSAEQPSTE